MDKVYLNHSDSDKGNLTIAYVTLNRNFLLLHLLQYPY